MGVKVEVCVDTSAGLAAAVKGGADRIELCAGLAVGGMTPSAGFMAEAAGCGLPVMAMIRPRAGDFVFSPAEVVQMQADIGAARHAGLAGVVLGASLPDGRLDSAVLRHLKEAAEGMDCTLHRAIDLVPDWDQALETAVSLGFSRILTSGGATCAEAGIDQIAAMITRAAGRISIMPGSGISPANAPDFVAIGVTEVHGSCAASMTVSGRAVDMGFGPAVERRTDAEIVRALRRAVN